MVALLVVHKEDAAVADPAFAATAGTFRSSPPVTFLRVHRFIASDFAQVR